MEQTEVDKVKLLFCSLEPRLLIWLVIFVDFVCILPIAYVCIIGPWFLFIFVIVVVKYLIYAIIGMYNRKEFTELKEYDSCRRVMTWTLLIGGLGLLIVGLFLPDEPTSNREVFILLGKLFAPYGAVSLLFSVILSRSINVLQTRNIFQRTSLIP
eukprot:TRINITY_DN9519_c0_g2_i1.p1 TRINITY_DN9519_c0_g2~~TRINITY_DN9519_c0_g2_i1.p1  ORF type:complete len:155 (+),score=15.04 TRINITY_DN9519_c0_g2_i1:95-559(+)